MMVLRGGTAAAEADRLRPQMAEMEAMQAQPLPGHTDTAELAQRQRFKGQTLQPMDKAATAGTAAAAAEARLVLQASAGRAPKAALAALA